MRIIAGSYRSRTLEAPRGLATRPTSDRLRETLFNVLAPRIEGASFLDLYAGSGAVGIEALSRGAARVEFVERAEPALRVLRGNLAGLGLTAGFRIHAMGSGAALRSLLKNSGSVSGLDFSRAAGASKQRWASAPEGQAPFPESIFEQAFTERKAGPAFDLVFLDPPYDAAAEYAATLGLLGGAAAGLLAEGAMVIAEHRKQERLDDAYGALRRTRLLEQGDAALSFYAAGSASAAE